ncbi:MAG: YbjQ family protein [Defluviitaleaceae bacterium]|nr:YbjQ family protein [Defluviitaleaceae bacterium]
MVVVTTPFIEGKKIKQYLRPVFCQATRGVGAFRGMGASWKGTTGGRSAGHEKSIVEVRATAVNEMIAEAKSLGANALIGLTVDIEMLSGDTLILCKGYATAVVIG